MMIDGEEDEYSPVEAALRRDEVIRRMANTPPQPNGKPKPRRRGKKKPTGRGRVARKGRAPGKS